MLRLERTTPQPLYQQISQWMHQQIRSGAWPEYYKLKSEMDLASELGVNRGTIRKAMSDLIAQGQLVRIHGRGTFVASRTLDQPLAERLIGVSEDFIEKGIAFETRVMEQSVQTPDPGIASLLALPTSARVFVLKRVRLVGGTPLVVMENFVAYDHCPGIERVDLGTHRLFETLEGEFRLKLDWGRRTFQAQPATEGVAEQLHIGIGEPVMALEQLVYLRDGSPIELSHVWFRGDRFRLTTRLKRQPPHERANSFHEFLPDSHS